MVAIYRRKERRKERKKKDEIHLEERKEETGREEMNHLSEKHTIGDRLTEVGDQRALGGNFSCAIY